MCPDSGELGLPNLKSTLDQDNMLGLFVSTVSHCRQGN